MTDLDDFCTGKANMDYPDPDDATKGAYSPTSDTKDEAFPRVR